MLRGYKQNYFEKREKLLFLNILQKSTARGKIVIFSNEEGEEWAQKIPFMVFQKIVKKAQKVPFFKIFE